MDSAAKVYRARDALVMEIATARAAGYHVSGNDAHLLGITVSETARVKAPVEKKAEEARPKAKPLSDHSSFSKNWSRE